MTRTYLKLVEVLGDQHAMILAKRFGGRSLYVPNSAGPLSPLVLVLGTELTVKMCAAFGGTYVDLPSINSLASANRITQIQECLSCGYTVCQVAKQFGVTARWVRIIKSRMVVV